MACLLLPFFAAAFLAAFLSPLGGSAAAAGVAAGAGSGGAAAAGGGGGAGSGVAAGAADFCGHGAKPMPKQQRWDQPAAASHSTHHRKPR